MFFIKVLVVCDKQKHIAYFEFMLKNNNFDDIIVSKTCKDARRILDFDRFDLIVVDSPLTDELGKNFTIQQRNKTNSQIIYCTDDILYEQIENELFILGINVISRPFNRKIFSNTLSTIYCASTILNRLDNENVKLNKQLEEIKIIDRAKCLLISYLNMNEKQAHKYIEKQAMDHRLAKIDIAKRLLKTYES